MIVSLLLMCCQLLLICIFLALVHHYIARFGRKGRLIDQIPGIIAIPIVGDIMFFGWATPEVLWLLMRHVTELFNPIYKFWFYTIPNIAIYKPTEIEKILSNTKHNGKKCFNYKAFKSMISNSIFIAEETKWQKKREVLKSAFHCSITKQFVEVFIEEGNRAVQSLDRTKETVIENLMCFTRHHSFSIICEVAMGISLQDNDPFEQQYLQKIDIINKIVVDRCYKSWLFSDTIFNLTSQSRKYTKYLNAVRSIIEKIIAKRKDYHEQTDGRYLVNFENNIEREGGEVAGIKKKRMAMLDILIAKSRNGELSDLDIRDEMHFFVYKNSLCVASALYFSLLLLAEHKDVQDRVRDEINEVMQQNDGKFTTTVLNNLPYLERCLKEAMRMYPSISFVSRYNSEDVKLHTYLVPQDTAVHCFIQDLHRDSDNWPDPEIFDPDRFLPENIEKRHPYAYLPFIEGPRKCLGQQFVMLELKAMIAPLIYNNFLEPVDYLKDATFKYNFVINTLQPMRMKVIPITRG